MPSISSLLKSAQSTQKKVKSQEDAYIAYQWENSAQTYEDFVEYSKYLDERIKTSNDPSDALSYQTKLRSANRSFTSNEIQRQQMNIMEGRGDTTTKMEAIQNLWERAIQAEDFNLAQNLMSQWDSLSIKRQNEQEAAVKALQANAAAGGRAYEDLTKSLTKGLDDVTLPSGEVVTPLAAIARDLEMNGADLATWEEAQATMEAIQATVIDQYNSATTQDQIDKLEEKYGPGLADIDKELKFSIGGKSLTNQDIMNAAANAKMNNPIYGMKAESQFNPRTGKYESKFTLQENAVSEVNYVRQLDENGQESYVPIQERTDQKSLFFGGSDQGRGLNTQFTQDGSVIGSSVNGDNKQGNIDMGGKQVKRDDSQTLENRLKELGYAVETDGTTLKLKLPGENVTRRATIQPDGTLRYMADDGNVMEVNPFDDRNIGTNAAPMIFKAGQQRVVDADEISDFSRQSRFGGDISIASAQGKRYTQSITGQSRVNTLIPGSSGISVSNNFAGYGGPATSGAFQGTSALLQGSAQTRKGIEQERQRVELQARTQALQASANQFDLNQTPVQQLAQNGVLKRQLAVAAPQAAQRVYVAPLPYTPIKSVGVAPRTQNITGVSVARPTGTVRVY
jgi:hypothetical protein